MYYLKDKNGFYYYEEDYQYLIKVDNKANAKPMSESIADAIIEMNDELIKEEV